MDDEGRTREAGGGSGAETIVLGAGCFWGVEDALARQPGVLATRVGYAGGDVEAPTYEQVCAGGTGHAEAVEVRFDPSVTTLEELLRYFWQHHAATASYAGQYRSLVVCDRAQLPTVERVKADVEAASADGPLATEVLADAPFYEAEEYHQQYYEKGREVARELRRRCELLGDV
jgi:peptide-methionine (S)-S-oxide reductase